MLNPKISALIISLFLLIGLVTVHKSKSQTPPAESTTDSTLTAPTETALIEEPTIPTEAPTSATISEEDDSLAGGSGFCKADTTENIKVTCPDGTEKTISSDKDCTPNNCKVSCGPYEVPAKVYCGTNPLSVQIKKCQCKGGAPPTAGYCVVDESEFIKVECAGGATTQVVTHKSCIPQNKCTNCGPHDENISICGTSVSVKRCYCKT